MKHKIVFTDHGKNEEEILKFLRVGAPVEYTKDGGQKGWVGQVTDINHCSSRITVRWKMDCVGRSAGVVQDYSVNALTSKNDRHEHADIYKGYLMLTESLRPDYEEDPQKDKLQPTWIIAGKLGGTPLRFRGSKKEARKVLEDRARKSNSGQPYVLYEAVAEATYRQRSINHKGEQDA